MTDRLNVLRYVYSSPDPSHIFIWDADVDYDPSPKVDATLIRNWLQTTQLGKFDSLPGFGGPYSCINFPDRESKVLFKMAFNVP